VQTEIADAAQTNVREEAAVATADRGLQHVTCAQIDSWVGRDLKARVGRSACARANQTAHKPIDGTNQIAEKCHALDSLF
jgi:hypothetical protein